MWYLELGTLRADKMRTESLINEICVFIKCILDSSIAPPAIWEYREKMTTIHEPESGLSSDSGSVGTLILHFPASGTVRN